MVTFTSPAITDISPQGMTVLIWAAPFHLNHLPERRIRNGFCAEAGSLPVQTRIPTFSIRMKKTGNMQISAFPCGSAQKKNPDGQNPGLLGFHRKSRGLHEFGQLPLPMSKRSRKNTTPRVIRASLQPPAAARLRSLKGISAGSWTEEKMTQLLLSEAQASDVSRFITPVWSHKGVSFEAGNDIGDSYVEIDLTNQKVWLYKDGKKLAATECVTGTYGTDRQTPGGVYSIYYRQSPAVLRGPGYASPVQYWMAFNGGIGLHDAQLGAAHSAVISTKQMVPMAA